MLSPCYLDYSIKHLADNTAENPIDLQENPDRLGEGWEGCQPREALSSVCAIDMGPLSPICHRLGFKGAAGFSITGENCPCERNTERYSEFKIQESGLTTAVLRIRQCGAAGMTWQWAKSYPGQPGSVVREFLLTFMEQLGSKITCK